MPKYYRFRATTPTRKPRRCKEKEKDRGIEKFRATTPTRKPRTCKEREVEKLKSDNEARWLGLTLAARQPAPSWYLRRTSWRESPPLIGFLRHLADVLGAPLQLNDRNVIAFKIPSTGSQEFIRQFY